MRLLDFNSMLLLLPADHASEQLALDRLTPIWDRTGADKSRLPRLTASGALRTMEIKHEGETVAVLWHRKEDERLVVDTLCATSKGRTTEEAWQTIWSGVERLAIDCGCSYVEGITRRAALAKVYAAHGFEACGVLMRKAVNV